MGAVMDVKAETVTDVMRARTRVTLVMGAPLTSVTSRGQVVKGRGKEGAPIPSSLATARRRPDARLAAEGSRRGLGGRAVLPQWRAEGEVGGGISQSSVIADKTTIASRRCYESRCARQKKSMKAIIFQQCSELICRLKTAVRVISGNARVIFATGAGGTTVPKGIPKEPKRITRNGRGQCTVCQHPERVRIEAMRAGGVTLDKLAEQFGVSKDSVWRHQRTHVTPEQVAGYLLGPAKVQQLVAIAAEESGGLLDYLKVVRSVLMGQFDRVAQKNDHNAVAIVSGRLLETLKAIGQITGEIGDLAAKTTINIQQNTTIINSAPFTELQAGLLRITAQHPEARKAIVALFLDLDRKYSGPSPVPMIEGQAMREVAHA